MVKVCGIPSLCVQGLGNPIRRLGKRKADSTRAGASAHSLLHDLTQIVPAASIESVLAGGMEKRAPPCKMERANFRHSSSVSVSRVFR